MTARQGGARAAAVPSDGATSTGTGERRTTRSATLEPSDTRTRLVSSFATMTSATSGLSARAAIARAARSVGMTSTATSSASAPPCSPGLVMAYPVPAP